MNGAPAKPISGVSPSSARSSRIAAATSSSWPGSSAGNAATAAPVRTGSATTGPVPGTMSTPMPAATSGTTMSEKRMAASTPWRRTGCIVISQTRSGVKQAFSIGMPSRTLRYSGSERPAWRMNQTGGWAGVPPAAATSRGAVAVRAVVSGVGFIAR